MRLLLFLTLCVRVLANTATLPANALSNRPVNDTAAGSIFVEKTALSSDAGCRLHRLESADARKFRRAVTPAP